MPLFEVAATGFVSPTTIFSPNLRGERRTYTFEADSEDQVRELFDMAVKAKVEGVLGASGVPFEIESITEVTPAGT